LGRADDRVTPRHGTGHIVPPKGDPAGHEIGDRGIRAAEHDVLAGAFEIIVFNRERSWTIPASDGLRILPDALAVRDMRIADRHVGGIQRDAAFLPERWIAVYEQMLKRNVVRDQIE
jgi:hypothetical protein